MTSQLILLVLITSITPALAFLVGQSVPVENTKVSIIACILSIILGACMFISIASEQEKESIIKYVNNEITYDTVSMDKNMKLLDIKIKNN